MKINLESWMSELPEPLNLIPITELAIPGIILIDLDSYDILYF